MKKLSEFKGEQAFEVLAEIIDSSVELFADPQFSTAIRTDHYLTASVYALKNHREAMIKILATLEEKTVEDFLKDANLFTLPQMALALLNDEQLVNFFHSQDSDVTSSGDASETITE